MSIPGGRPGRAATVRFMARKPPQPPSDHKTPATEPASPLDDNFALPVGAAATPVPGLKPPLPAAPVGDKPAKARPVKNEDAKDDAAGDADDDDDDDEDDEDEDLVVFTAREAAG